MIYRRRSAGRARARRPPWDCSRNEASGVLRGYVCKLNKRPGRILQHHRRFIPRGRRDGWREGRRKRKSVADGGSSRYWLYEGHGRPRRATKSNRLAGVAICPVDKTRRWNAYCPASVLYIKVYLSHRPRPRPFRADRAGKEGRDEETHNRCSRADGRWIYSETNQRYCQWNSNRFESTTSQLAVGFAVSSADERVSYQNGRCVLSRSVLSI